MKFCTHPTSLDRCRYDLARREGLELSPSRHAGIYCELFDSSIGGKGPSSNQVTQTVSGTGRGLSGNKNQYTESGSISVGQKGKYQEQFSTDFGTKNAFGSNNKTNVKAKNITVQDSGGAAVLAAIDKLGSLAGQPSSQNTQIGQVSPPTPTPGPSVGTDATATNSTPGASSSDASTSTAKKAGLSIGVLLLAAVAVWFLFFRKK